MKEPNEQKEGGESRFAQLSRAVSRVLDVFEKNSLISEGYRIQRKYPKYLSKFELLDLQLKDAAFRETFLIQLQILLETLKHPVNALQRKAFLLSSDDVSASTVN